MLLVQSPLKTEKRSVSLITDAISRWWPRSLSCLRTKRRRADPLCSLASSMRVRLHPSSACMAISQEGTPVPESRMPSACAGRHQAGATSLFRLGKARHLIYLTGLVFYEKVRIVRGYVVLCVGGCMYVHTWYVIYTVFIYFSSHLQPIGPVAILPVVTNDLPISPRFTPYEIFYRDASSALLQLVNQWLSFTYSRTINDGFRHGCQNKNPALTRIEHTTSALAGVQVIY